MKPSDESLEKFRERLTKARSRLLCREPFLGFLSLELPTRIIESAEHSVQTAATDGRSYMYSYLWCRQLTDPELVFVVAHEVAHVMFLHASRCEGRDWQLWNDACDFAINGLLLASADAKGSLSGVAVMPAEINTTTGRSEHIGLWDKRFAQMPAELIYEKLLKEARTWAKNWDQLLKAQTESEADSSAAAARGAVAKALIRAAENREREGRGDGPGQWERWAEQQIGGTVRWQDRFRQRILQWGLETVSWNRPNKKFRSQKLYLPSYRGHQLPDILFAFDTSSSISDRFLGQMVGELNQLLLSARNSTVRLVCCDTKLSVVGDFSAGRRLDPRTQPLRGGGGTDFRPVFDYACLHKSFRYLVFLTDAEGTFPKEQPPHLCTLWLIPEQAPAEVPFGEVIYLPRNP